LSAFADASALVKLYADEEGCEPIRRLEAIAVAQVSRVEVPAALWRKHRLGELAAEGASILTAEFEADYFGTEDGPRRFAPVTITGPLLDQAARLCAAHGLRAYDGVQLSSALVSRDADPACTTFAAFDLLLRGAAAAEGFALVPAGR
jgi:predicted nucleic acid-binding protein